MNIPLFVAAFAVVCALIYVLYRQGFGVLKRISAIMFVFRPGKNADRATLDSCTGWVKHAGRFSESRTYDFLLNTHLSKGNAEVALLDGKRQTLMKLTPQQPSCKIDLDAKNRYYLRWDFQSATGKCELQW